MRIPRPEYPRPQMVRAQWLNLNGEWEFEMDNARVGREKEYYKRNCLDSKITVPFCPESKLSGVEHTDFINAVWYRKEICVPKEWQGQRILMHFGAVDYHAFVYVNGSFVGEHRGGYTSFSFDITSYLTDGTNVVMVYAEDDPRSGLQPCGKQSLKLEPSGCHYSRVTGIWQTVWLECVPEISIRHLKIDTDIQQVCATVQIELSCHVRRCELSLEAFFEGQPVGQASAVTDGKVVTLHLPLSQKHLWSVGQGNLYDLRVSLHNDDGIIDQVESYFGLRSFSFTEEDGFLLNGKKFFGRWVLDQGYYPDGIYTPADEECFKRDIEASMQLGFNGARLHERIFEPLFLYWADKLGYTVWAEHANWGLNTCEAVNIYNFLSEWIEAMSRDYSHPCVIGWCPFNETWNLDGHQQYDELIGMVYDITKQLDPYRPVIDTSGNYHVRTDVFDIHLYTQEPDLFREAFAHLDEGFIKDENWNRDIAPRQAYPGGLIFVSEYGGSRWDECGDGWGYGVDAQTEKEFFERYRSHTETLLQNKKICAFCYTQLYDVYQEKNGLLTFDRKFKFEPGIFREIQEQTAAIEE